MLNPGYSKTVLKSSGGDTLLPMTTASMVSEEPDRRFVDNVEKTLLFLLADNVTQLKTLADHQQNLVLLAENADDIVPQSENRQAMQKISENLEALAVITENLHHLLIIASGEIVLNATNGDVQYKLMVDNSDRKNPTLRLTEVDNKPTVDTTD